MLIPEAEWLFEQVEIGTPVFIVPADRGRPAELGGQVVAVGVVAALLGLLVWKVAKGRGDVTGTLGRGGTPTAPAFALERLDGDGELSLASLRGKAVVVNFWASWCCPCKDEAPLLEEGWQRWRDKDVVVLGVDVKDFRGDARRFMRRFGVTLPDRLRRQGLDASAATA